MLPVLCLICCQLTANCGQLRTNVRQMYEKCYPIGSLLETNLRVSNVLWDICPFFAGHLSQKRGTFVRTFLGHFRTSVGQEWDRVGTWIPSNTDFAPEMGKNGTFVLKMRDICPFFTGHLSGHSSLEIEYRVRDRERENHPPVPPLKGGLRCAKK